MTAKEKVAKKKAAPDAARLARAGQKAMQSGEYEDAVTSFEQVLAGDPNHLTATYGLAYSLGALVDAHEGTKRTKTIDRVLELAQRLIELTPEDSLWPYLVLFQENYYRDNFYVFRSKDHSVHAFYHDDEFVWSKKLVDFATHVRKWVQDVLDDD